MRRNIIGGDKASDTTYLLLTEGNYAYHYRPMNTETERFNNEKVDVRNRIIEGQQILLDWIKKPIGESPAYICWNWEGKALLYITLTSIFNPIPEYNNMVSEINPFEFLIEKWVVDTTRDAP